MSLEGLVEAAGRRSLALTQPPEVPAKERSRRSLARHPYSEVTIIMANENSNPLHP
jgi:hypothetical protein